MKGGPGWVSIAAGTARRGNEMLRRKALRAGPVAVMAALAWLGSASAETGHQATSVSHGGSTSWAQAQGSDPASPAAADRGGRRGAGPNDGGASDTGVVSTGQQSAAVESSPSTGGSARPDDSVGQSHAILGNNRRGNGATGSVNVSRVTGGDSLASGDSSGGHGGAPEVHSNPVANSGNSGDTDATSSATNTGNTGPANSSAESNPVSTSGGSGGTGETGGSSDQSVRRTGRSGSVVEGRAVFRK